MGEGGLKNAFFRGFSFNFPLKGALGVKMDFCKTLKQCKQKKLNLKIGAGLKYIIFLTQF